MTAETCVECDGEATHEARAPDGTRWEPVCEDHADGAFERGHEVRVR
jgi:hypothetical protein